MSLFLVVDSFGLLFRSYYAQFTRPLTNLEGKNINAWFGFLKSILSAVETYRPQGVLFALESESPNWRDKLYPEYKIKRQETPPDLIEQIPLVLSTLEYLGWPLLKKEGYEADDCIASLARLCKQQAHQLYILSADKDLMQLVGENVFLLKPGKSGLDLLDAEGVFREKGVYPHQIRDWLSFVGDDSDNLPGVKGIGEKTAQQLLSQYQSWDNVWNHLDELKPGVRKNLFEGRDLGELTRTLVGLSDQLDFDLDLQSLTLTIHQPQKLLDLVKSQNAKTLLQSLQQFLATQNQKALPSQKTLGEQGDLFANFSGGADSSPEFRFHGQYVLLDDLVLVNRELELAAQSGIVAFDTETTGLDPRIDLWLGFSFCYQEGQAFWVPVNTNNSNQLQNLLNQFFSNPGLKIVAHNWNYDWKVLKSAGVNPPPAWFDTMTAAWLLDVNKNGYKLEDLALQYLGLDSPDYKSLVPKGGTLKDVSVELLTKYAAKDADFTLRLYHVFIARLRELELEELFFNLEIPVENLLCQMEWRGILLDPTVLAQLSKQFQEEINKLEQQAYELVGHAFNLNSTQQLQKVLFEERSLLPTKKTKTGLSTDSETLEELAALDPLPAVILKYRQFTKLKSTYVDTLPSLINPKTQRVHTNFLITGTATGRLSSKDPNLQNIPIREEEGRAIRQAFRAPPGWSLISADYNQIELVVLAHFSEDPVLVEAFEQGLDIHRRTASLVFNVAESEVSPGQRRAAKAINFGIIYGMSAFRLSRELGISRSEASTIIKQYFERLSRVQDWIKSTVETAQQQGFIRTLLGRRRPIPLLASTNQTEHQAGERMAVNSLIQGSAADVMKTAMLKVHENLASQEGKAHLLLQVHDELLLECVQDQVGHVTEMVKTSMEKALVLRVPLRVSVEVATNWGELH